MLRKINIYSLFILLLLPFIMVVIWFHSGNILGGGESGLPFYDFKTQLNLVNRAWGEGGLGLGIGIVSASKPTYLFFVFLENLGLKGFLLQAVIFYTLFCFAGISMFFLAKKLFPVLPNRYALLAVLFYWFNPISSVNIWNRFLYNYMFFWSVLPTILLILLLLLEKRKLLYIFILNLVMVAFSFVQSSLPLILVSWLLIAVTFLFYFWTNIKQGKRFYLISLPLLVILYILTNFWWITQSFSFILSSDFSTTSSLFFTTSNNLSTLTSLSRILGNFEYVFRFMHSTFIKEGPIWARVYSFPVLSMLSFLPSALILWVIYKYHKVKEVMFLSIIFLGTLFLMKGDQPPFGELFQYLFVKFSFIQVFRNPFEKFGFLLPLAAAPLFSFGLKELVDSTSKPFLKRVYYFLLAAVVVILWGFPFWTGLVFTSTTETNINELRSYEVIVPKYYQEANDWLLKQGDNFRFISFPLGGEGMTYTWDKPYSGVELSSVLFNTPNISFNTSVPYYDKIASSVENDLVSNSHFSELLSLLNVKYLILREDIDWKVRGLRDPATIKQKLDSDKNFKLVKVFGKISIYSISNNYLGEKIYASVNNFKVYPQMKIEDIFLVGGQGRRALYAGDESTFFPNTLAILINPKQVNFYQNSKKYDFQLALDRLLYSRHSPQMPVYQLMLIKEDLERKLNTSVSDERYIYDLTHLGKRVVELYNVVRDTKDQNLVSRVSKTYVERLRWLINEYPEKFTDSPSNSFKQATQDELTKHETVLKYIKEEFFKNNNSMLDAGLLELDKVMLTSGFKTANPILIQSPADRFWVYKFEVDHEGEYSIYLDNNQLKKFFNVDPHIKLQVDDVILTPEVVWGEELISLGKINLKKGMHEMVIAEPESVNLLNTKDQIILNSDNNRIIESQIEPFDPDATYIVDFDYWIEKGSRFYINLIRDNDIATVGNLKKGDFTFSSDFYNHSFKHGNLLVGSTQGAKTFKIVFTVGPYNDCSDAKRVIFPSSCKDKNYKKLFDKESEVLIKNLTVKKLFTSNIRFIQMRNQDASYVIPQVDFKKINSAEYKVHISEAKVPYVLVFSELFNSGWKLELLGKIIDEKNHYLVNAYSNGWLIDKPGTYDLTLKFSTQNSLEIGERVSLLSVVGLLVLLTLMLVQAKKQILRLQRFIRK